ncbi:MAG: trehalose-phosphatase [Candidatus Eisenbacteria bacterium]|nr:trehalose-phosphatase [Candidatus Eisenbacteria bacterium]
MSADPRAQPDRIPTRPRSAASSGQRIDALIFDLDGVLTRTATLHAAAWKEMFDEFLRSHAERHHRSYEPFDADADYRRYVDGKPRYDGVRSFLRSRDIELPWGSPDDPPEKETICGLGNRKNERFRQRLANAPVETYEPAVDFVRRARQTGYPLALVSSSRNTPAILASADLRQLFDVVIDGNDLDRKGLSGKPDPDIFLEAARRLGVPPQRAAVFEDAASGVRAASAGGFGLVIGVAREASQGALRTHGADRIVRDFGSLPLPPEATPSASDADRPAAALAHLEEIVARLDGRAVAALDYDGTLTPIVSRPEDAHLDTATREVLGRLAARLPVVVISGRDLADVRERVALDGIHYAGSHGFEIVGPDGGRFEQPEALEILPRLDAVERRLREACADLEGVQVERKRFSVAVHVRRADEGTTERAAGLVRDVGDEESRLRLSHGHEVYDLQPDLEWDKGHALRRILDELGEGAPSPLPAFYIGDDTTDEDAFRTLGDRGVSIVVMQETRETAADYALRDPYEVRRFLRLLLASWPKDPDA